MKTQRVSTELKPNVFVFNTISCLIIIHLRTGPLITVAWRLSLMLLEDSFIPSSLLPSIHLLYTLLLPSGSGFRGLLVFIPAVRGRRWGYTRSSQGHRTHDLWGDSASHCTAPAGRPANKASNCFPNQGSSVKQQQVDLFLLLFSFF